MEYVNVGSGRGPPHIEEAIARNSPNSLISLIGGLHQKEFGYDTLQKVSYDIAKYRRQYIEPFGRTLYVDSGGYSIIKGDIKPQDTSKANGCYQKYLEIDRNSYDYIFSLDIPVNLKYPSFNTKENLYRFNKESLNDSKQLLIKYPELCKKFIFVWQFKIPMQYAVWNKLYDELNLSQIIQNRAIGGMVGMRNVVNIDFSPFTALAYRCLDDYLKAGRYDFQFRLHYLGINILYDRFHIAFLEKLFERYLNSNPVEMTYDSISSSREAQMNFKSMDFYDFNGDLEMFKGVLSVPSEVIRKVYCNDEYIFSELENVRTGRRLRHADAFTPLSLHSTFAVDRYFSDVIEKYGLVDLMFCCRNIIRLKHELRSILDKLSKENPIFTSKMIDVIVSNAEITYKFHRCFMDQRNSLEQLIEAFIGMIEFP